MKINYKAIEDELALRFNNMAHLVTEDLIRQWFIEKQKLTIKNTIIEVPYIQPQKAKKQTPLVIKDSGIFKRNGKNLPHADLYIEKCDAVIEFKYHKKSLYSTTAKTTNTGEVFRDLNRLSMLDNKEKYFIYVFDQEMKDYYDRQSFDILKVGNYSSAQIPSALSKYIKDEHGEFYKSAFSSFSDNYQDFSCFGYMVEVLYSNRITTYKTFDENSDNSIYMIILQVK